MFNKDILVERLNVLMNDNKITKQALASHIGIHRSSVSQICHGVNLPSIDTLVAIAEYFNVTTDYLLGISENPKSHS